MDFILNPLNKNLFSEITLNFFDPVTANKVSRKADRKHFLSETGLKSKITGQKLNQIRAQKQDNVERKTIKKKLKF